LAYWSYLIIYLIWHITQARKTTSGMTRYEALLRQNQDQTLSATDRAELTALWMEGDRFMLCKAQAAAIQRWRGQSVVHR
jgi:hypothetical protein